MSVFKQKKSKDDRLDQTEPQQKDEAVSELELLKAELKQAKEREMRLLADYQNLKRHSQSERLSLLKMANKDFCLAILEPLEHLALAAEHMKDPGLNMVIEQLWKRLNDLGLERINVLDKKFDLASMEVVDKEGDGDRVVKVVRNGYTLAGEIIQHAQVILA